MEATSRRSSGAPDMQRAFGGTTIRVELGKSSRYGLREIAQSIASSTAAHHKCGNLKIGPSVRAKNVSVEFGMQRPQRKHVMVLGVRVLDAIVELSKANAVVEHVARSCVN